MPGTLLECICQALVAKATNVLVRYGPLRESICDIAQMAMDEWKRQRPDPGERRAALEALAQVSEDDARGLAQSVANGLGPYPLREPLTAYLLYIPATIRRSFARSADPTGRTAPDELLLDEARHLLRFLPLRAPRFQRGQRPLPGEDLELVELLGIGGFGEVWKAKFRSPRWPLWDPRFVALKFCLEEDANRILRHEQGVLEQVQKQGGNPGVVKLRRIYLDADPPCLEYEYIAGEDLGRQMRLWAEGPAKDNPQRSLLLMHELVDIVAAAHRLDPPVVHRDLKPANILLESTPLGPRVRVTDFGIGGLATRQAKTQTQTKRSQDSYLLTRLAGAYTPVYASTEQMKGEQADPRDDVHALGVIWYQLLLGDLTAKPPPDWNLILQERGVGAEVIAVVGQCLASSKRRLKNALLLAQALESLLPPGERGVLPPGEYRVLPPGEWPAATTKPTQGRVDEFGSGKAEPISAPQAPQPPKPSSPPMRPPTDPKALFEEGEKYYWGRGVKQDYARAVELYRQAAKQGYAPAQCNLGWMYQHGRGVKQDDARAVELYRQAAEQGQAYIYEKELEEKELDDALNRLLRDRGEDECPLLPTELLLQPATPKAAAPPMRPLSNPKAVFEEGQKHFYGRGVKQDYARAAELYRQAAEQGLAAAQSNLGWMYENGRGVKQDDARAVELYRQAAEQGFARAQYSLGAMYDEGLGVKQDYAKAVELYRQAAKQGYSAAQYSLGEMYDYGQGVKQDYARAVELYRQGAKQGLAGAQSNLGWMYQNGRGVKQDNLKAVELYRQAAEQGDAEAQYNLGWMYMNGRGVKRDFVRAAELFRQAAEQGLAKAQYNLGWMYANGRGVKQDDARAAELFRQAAEQGQANAQSNLGWMYANGEGVKQDDAKAAELFRQAAAQEYAPAQCTLGAMYSMGRGVKQDDAKAVELYRQAAEQGYAPAQDNLGWMYANGRGVKQDDARAVELYRQAAEQGYARAQFNLGAMYEEGRGVKQNYPRAAAFYRQAAEQGHAKAQCTLGEMSANGRGVKQDYANAVELYRLAAVQGLFAAQVGLGWMYENGQGVKQDYPRAVELYRQAAEQGDARAQFNLGAMYEEGRGVMQDVARAVELYRLAASQGDEYAKQALTWRGPQAQPFQHDPSFHIIQLVQ